ncbi:unnamed protein product [Lasius platythorax]|uniref:MADF domain-containing protein n=1 Tax=Lasius platythorax TaxID=488582 RepID=A0AAV2NHK5_9HYME
MAEPNSNESLDIELFIEEIKKYPEIWNVAAEEYHDRTKKRSAWIDICRVFCDGFDEKNERDKNEICNKLIKKWRNIKDNYLKSTKRNAKSGAAADTGRWYIYARQLSFLQHAGATTDTQSSLGAEDEEQSQDRNEEAERVGPSSPPRYDQNTKKRKRNLESTLIDFMKAPIPSQPRTRPESEPNADRSFFDSLIPAISGFTEDQKLEFRCEILNIIKRMRGQLNAASTSINLQPDYARYTTVFQPPSHAPFFPSPSNSNYIPQTPSYQHSSYAQRPLSAPETHSNAEEDCFDIYRQIE